MEILDGKYKISTIDIGTIFRNISNNELIYDPFYQRNFVWMEEDQIDFMRTIIMGYPCPEIFLAEGKIDLETHIKYIHIIDGQQRVTTIKRFFQNEICIDGKYYKDFTDDEKTKISRYEIGTVTLKLNPETDIHEIEEIFRRLNKNKYTLSETEKKISLLSDNEFMLMSRLFSGDLIIKNSDEIEEDTEKLFQENPFIKDEFKKWALSKDFSVFINFLEKNCYTSRQIVENYPVKDILDIIGCFINQSFHSRILQDEEIIELSPKVWERREEIYFLFIQSFEILKKIKFENSKIKKYFLHKRGNFFSLLLAIINILSTRVEIIPENFSDKLNVFYNNLPVSYKDALRNSTMDRKQRATRNEHLTAILKESIHSPGQK